MALVPAAVKALPTSEESILQDVKGRFETITSLLTKDYPLLEVAIKRAEAFEGAGKSLVLVPYDKGFYEIGVPNYGGIHLPQPYRGVNTLWHDKTKIDFLDEMARSYQNWMIEVATFMAVRINSKKFNILKCVLEWEPLPEKVRHYNLLNTTEAKERSCYECRGENKGLGICCVSCYRWAHLDCLKLDTNVTHADKYLCKQCCPQPSNNAS